MKVCLMVGASGVLGGAVAQLFDREGALLALAGHGRKPNGLFGKPARNERSLSLQFNVRHWKEVNLALEQVQAHFGGLDVVVNCAGFHGPIGPTQTIEPTTCPRTVEIHLSRSFSLSPPP